MMQHSRVRAGVVFGLFAVLALSLGACGGGEKTVTVTQTVASEPGKGDNKKQTNPSEVVSEGGAVAGYVDNVSMESDSIVLTGWAASADLSGPATSVTAEVAGEQVAKAVPALERQDVVEALGEPGLAESGFELRLPLDSLECGAPAAGIQVIASLGGESNALPYGEGTEEAVTDAC